jgi:hypothetical protein
MPILLLASGDANTGRQFGLFADELAYAMGSDFDFQKVELPKEDAIVLNPICIDPAIATIANSVSHKRSAREFWTSYNVDHAGFSSANLAVRIGAIRDAMVGAARQVPSSRMPAGAMAEFERAATAAAARLLIERDRLPR